MARIRRRFDASFKAKIAIEALRELRTVSEIAKQYRVHPNQVRIWRVITSRDHPESGRAR